MPDKGSTYSIQERIALGKEMLESGWIVEFKESPDYSGEDYVWRSPEGGNFKCRFSDLPPYIAVLVFLRSKNETIGSEEKTETKENEKEEKQIKEGGSVGA